MSYTTVFTNGGSQAVRIPREFRFATSRVSVQAYRGGVLLMPVNDRKSIDEIFSLCDELTDSERDFLSSRMDNVAPQTRELFA